MCTHISFTCRILDDVENVNYNSRMDMIYPYGEILYSSENEQSTNIGTNID